MATNHDEKGSREMANHLTREKWGTCDMSYGFTSHPGVTERCNRPAVYVDRREDSDGNHLRYCAECAKIS